MLARDSLLTLLSILALEPREHGAHPIVQHATSLRQGQSRTVPGVCDPA